MPTLEKARNRPDRKSEAFETIHLRSADLAGRLASDRDPAVKATIDYSRILVSDGKAFGDYVFNKRTGRVLKSKSGF